jgi:hypothetical protein
MYYLRSDLCVSVCFVLSVTFFYFLFFWLQDPYGRTDLLDCMRRTKLNWNNWNLSVHPYIRTHMTRKITETCLSIRAFVFRTRDSDKFLPLDVLPPDRICIVICLSFVIQHFFLFSFFFFGLGPPYGRTDLWLFATELKLNWNNYTWSVHPWHSLLTRKNNWNLSVHPCIRVPLRPDFRTYWLKKKKKKKWLTDFIQTDGYSITYIVALHVHCALRCVHCICITCITLRCVAIRYVHTDWT